jgi:geranylgeranyl diphosphate synthase type I
VLEQVGEELAPLADALVQLVAGGKRLRPAFCYWGHRAAGGRDGEAIVKAAAALELFQACAIIHDDVMDGSDTRRGMPSAHRRFAGLHRSEGWQGDPEAFGEGAAILLGDLCLAWSDEMLATSGFAPDELARGDRVFAEMRTELMGGQYLDLLEQARGGGSVARALRVARFKSAKYTIEKPLHLGAALAGADQEVLDGCSGYGLPLGEAFQLRDDLLGVFGDPAQTGKPAGDDLREGKRTVLVAMALEAATAAQAEVVRRHLGDPHLSDEGVAALRTVLVETGAVARVEGLIAELYDDALVALDAAPLQDDAREVLRALAAAATARSV